MLECERVEGSEKLLKFKIDLGEEQPRQILSGIAKYYEPSSLVGKQVCVLANLKERTMMKKYVSQGMILSASDGSLTLLGTQGKVKKWRDRGLNDDRKFNPHNKWANLNNPSISSVTTRDLRPKR